MNKIIIGIFILFIVLVFSFVPIETETISCIVVNKNFEKGDLQVSVHPYVSVSEEPDEYVITIEGTDSKGNSIHTKTNISKKTYETINIGDKYNYKKTTKVLGKLILEKVVK